MKHHFHRNLMSIVLLVTFVMISFVLVGAERAVLHEVRPGETLSGIATAYGTTVENLASLNALSDPHNIRSGEVIVVALAPSFHTVEPGESLWTIANQYGVTIHALLLFNDLPNPDHVLPGQTLTIPPAGGADAVTAMALQATQRRPSLEWPIDGGGGVITSLFGPRGGRNHNGLDIAAPTGTAVRAAADGRVTYADWGGTYGMLVVVEHGDGMLTRYAHNSRIVVQPGQYVRAGTHLADVGSTGRSTGPHLHFEVEINGEVVDPLTMLPTGSRRP